MSEEARNNDADVRNESVFQWNEQRGYIAVELSKGRTQKEVAAEFDIDDRTIRRWLQHPGFAAEVDRLSLMVDVAGRAERLRIAMRAIRNKVKEDGRVMTEKDVLDWLKFAQSETDGAKLDLTALLDAHSSVAPEGPARVDGASEESESPAG